MSNDKYSIRKKMLIYVIGMLIALLLCMGLITYIKVSELLLNQNKENGVSIAISASKEIDGDAFEQINSETCKEYKDTLDVISKYNNIDSVKYIYTMKMYENTLRFVVDADPDEPAEFMEEYEMFDDILPAFNGSACSDTDLTYDKWGTYISSYAPIFNKNGEVVGIVGIDTEVEYINEYKKSLITIIIFILVSFGIIGILLYIRISKDFAGKDGITGLYTQEYFEYIALNKYEKMNVLHQFTMIMMNIHDFRLINTKYGYAVGDGVLKYIANIINPFVNEKGIASRPSSDNYFVIIENKFVDKFLNSLTDIKYKASIANETYEINIPLSIGIYAIHEGDTISDVISRGLVVLRNAKNSKSSNIEYYSDEMFETALYEREILAEFSNAIKNNEFTVYFQPKVDIKNNRLYGAEALVRWIRDGQMIPPWKFIPVYEREGLITDLDFYVFENVCKYLKEWKENGYELFPISSNFSKAHLIQENFADRIIETADKYGVDHNYLDIELTESSGYSNKEQLNNFISKIRASGIHTSMDDFGSGYSSLELLDSNYFDIIKIDKTLTDKLEKDSNGQKFIVNIVNTITDSGCQVVCEGVESKEQVEFLRNNTACFIAQGYYYDKPLSKLDFEERIRNSEYKM